MKMKSTDLLQQRDVASTLSERARLQCARAKALEEAGEFEDARRAISEFWQRIGERPSVDGLDALAQAEVFLRAGTLSGWIGSAGQITGAQEIAKDLISEAARIFEESNLVERVAEARVDLAICYWREGAFDEARVSLDDAFLQLGDIESEQRLRAFLNRAIVERTYNRYEDALKTHREAAPLFAASSKSILKSKFHQEYATVLKNLGLARNNEDYIDQALVEYSAASFHAEQAGNKRFLALIKNNVGYLFVRLGRYPEAQQHLNRARSLFVALNDKGMVAQVDDTRARALISLGRFTRAETLARAAAKVLETGDEPSLFAEALTTHGTALARLGNFSKARATFEKAIRIAHSAGDLESEAVAALSMVEELSTQLPFNELFIYYRLAESELVKSQHPEIQQRLGKCARLLLTTQSLQLSSQKDPVASRSNEMVSAHSQLTPELTSSPVLSMAASLEEQVLHYEGDLIRRALEAADGSVTRAARMLGVTHQGLAFILNGRHKNLLPARKPVKRRRRSIIRFH